jgi:hypothetical protein
LVRVDAVVLTAKNEVVVNDVSAKENGVESWLAGALGHEG